MRTNLFSGITVCIYVAVFPLFALCGEKVQTVRFAPPWTSPFTVDQAYPFSLVNREGTHLFILNKTAWAYFACQNPQAVLDRAKNQGVNVLRVALEGVPYENELHLDLWPWEGTRANPDWNHLNVDYWKKVESRIQQAGNNGIGLDIVLYFSLKLQEKDIESQIAYWDTIIAILGKYANVLTWEIQNEYTGNEAFQDAAGRYLRKNDPSRRPVCSSDGTTDDALWPQKSWMDLAVVHTCTGTNYDLQDWYLSVARNTRSHGKPAFNNETGRENRHKNDDGVYRRKQGWLWCAAGGYWTWHSWDGCEGIDHPMYQAPGAEFVKPMAHFFSSLPFWKMAPNYTALIVQNPNLIFTSLAEPSRDTIICYLCTKTTSGLIAGTTVSLHLPDGTYRMDCINPADGNLLQSIPVSSAGWRSLQSIPLPPFTDDLLLAIRKIQPGEKSVIPGTK